MTYYYVRELKSYLIRCSVIQLNRHRKNQQPSFHFYSTWGYKNHSQTMLMLLLRIGTRINSIRPGGAIWPM